jgi:DNA anti-recombination protein RmuC
MHPDSQKYTNVTPIPNAQPDLHHVMYRIDQLADETHKLREEMQTGFAQVRSDIASIRTEQAAFKKELADQRLEYTKEFGSCRAEFKADLAESRAEFKADLAESRAEFKADLAKSRAEFKDELQKMREKSREDFDAMVVRTKIDMKELVASVVASVDDRIKMSGQASDLRLLKWCARAAISSSAAAGSLAYAVSKLMP